MEEEMGRVLTVPRRKTYPFISRSACDLMDMFKTRWLSSKVASSSRFMLREKRQKTFLVHFVFSIKIM